MNKALLIGVGLLVVICVAILLLTNEKSTDQSSSDQINTRLIQAISDSRPTLVRDGSPAISISSLSTPEEGWYIVTIKSIHDNRDDPVAVRVVITKSRNSDKFQTILGPGVSFTESEMLQYNIPDSIMKELL